MKNVTLAALAAAMMLMTSCSSSNQFFGTTTGMAVGGMFGSAIGGITGGWRGHDVGRVVGMAVGGAIGAAATAPKTSDGNYRTSDNYNRYERDDYRQNNSYSPFADLEVQNVRFVDVNHNNGIDAGEQTKLVFDIRNIGRDYVYDIAPVITVTGTKQIFLSPTAIISELAPGKGVRYTAEVVATKKLKNGTAEFTIGFSNGDQFYTIRTFSLPTYDNKHRNTEGSDYYRIE
ncbi:MAG: glycine zipper family protein [Muribaculaceae bacterium]|nr:glycine zipper family protein [Muribaculaceae bacterium]MBR1475724.1 glycine zipper family protein [Muribaculaceae bacterium]